MALYARAAASDHVRPVGLACHIGSQITELSPLKAAFAVLRRMTLDLRAQERTSIERALARFAGNRKKAAAALNISTVTLWRKMKQYGVSG